MTVGSELDLEVDGARPVAGRRAPRLGHPGHASGCCSFSSSGSPWPVSPWACATSLPVAWRRPTPWRFGLTLLWALVGVVDARRADRVGTACPRTTSSPGWTRSSAMVALTAGRRAETLHADGGARDVATVAALLVTAISFHFLVALPDGRLPRLVPSCAWSSPSTWHHWASGSALAVSPARLLARRRRHQLGHRRRCWPSPHCAPATSASLGHGRERMEWFGIGVTAGRDRRPGGRRCCTCWWVGPGRWVRWPPAPRRWSPWACWPARVGRLAPQPAGSWSRCWRCSASSWWSRPSTSWSSSAWATRPTTTGDKEALALSMVASGVAAVIFVPVR